MMAAALVLGYLLARPGWIVAYVCASAVATVAVLYYAIDTGDRPAPPRHKATRHQQRKAADAETITWVTTELHHDGGQCWQDTAPGNAAPAFLPAPPADPALTHTLTAEPGESFCDECWSTCAGGDPCSCCENAPETPALPPPPVNHAHQAAIAVGAAIAATAKQIAEKERERAEELAAEAAATSPWEERVSMWNLLSQDTITRGMPAIRDEGDWDAPTTIPPEVLHEMEAGV